MMLWYACVVLGASAVDNRSSTLSRKGDVVVGVLVIVLDRRTLRPLECFLPPNGELHDFVLWVVESPATKYLGVNTAYQNKLGIYLAYRSS